MTLTDIANVALEEIGAKPIGNIDGDDVNARKIKRRLPLSIAEVAAMRNWSCLVKRVPLSRRNDKSVGGRAVYNKPRNLLKVLEPEYGVNIESDYILAPEGTTELTCTIADDNPDNWNVYFRLAVIAQLKCDIAFTIMGDPNSAMALRQLAERDIQRYMKQDMIQSTPRRPKMPTIPEGYFL